LDDAEVLIIPKDLEKQFLHKPNSKKYFLNLSRSDKRNILQWLIVAVKPEARQKRIQEIAELVLCQDKQQNNLGNSYNRIFSNYKSFNILPFLVKYELKKKKIDACH